MANDILNLNDISSEIRDIIKKRQEELGLLFDEDNHIYTMRDNNGVVRSDWVSVSRLIHNFYDEFPTQEASLKKAKGDLVLQQELLKQWEAEGTYSTNLGSRVHYILETNLLKRFNFTKSVRQPIFECNEEQIIKSNNMISSGMEILNKYIDRGLVLLDTEIVLGDPDLKYVGQPDKVWLAQDPKSGRIGIVVTDWKSNKSKNFETTRWTKSMYPPFDDLPNIALGHYNIQLPFYARLIKKMLLGSKYEDILVGSCIIVHLREDSYKTYQISRDTINKVFELDLSKFVK
jgi:hypothetical protein